MRRSVETRREITKKNIVNLVCFGCCWGWIYIIPQSPFDNKLGSLRYDALDIFFYKYGATSFLERHSFFILDLEHILQGFYTLFDSLYTINYSCNAIIGQESLLDVLFSHLIL